ncbi:putative quorum-quenching lactonase YtnP [Pelagimonas phthalicica]|uniref:Putative quorum-quenching lactonase YtnP n=1 Tax=Pelagimonas phthalicica TaxID=1037362 RepID=A0A238J9F9_9RHOB|nr:MBL fold metallo-hydrolase [Pelagimonas phthalicica]TDS94254.1 glyoxylase-like metal-dependent hydrolase (beta-lactamase superfamily II) [Pelagimonas phthalicica]SMX27219.1 putative quorum-quenching lactonase YtnP [Pelagimonas phthalicica]
MRDLVLTRRNALFGGAAMMGASVTGIPGAAAGTDLVTPKKWDQVPYFYRFKHGSMRGTVISDGILPLGEPSASFLGTTKEEVGQMLTNNFLDPNNVILEQNILVLDTGSKLVLFDTGMGHSEMFGPTTGQMMKNLAAAGIDPADIDAIVCTHAHCDHVWGIIGSNGVPNFPNAQIYISQTDFEFWTDEAKLSWAEPGYMKAFVAGARANLLPMRDRIVFFKDGEEFLPGIQAMAAPGHTLGHTIFMIESDGETMAAIGDTTHHHVLLLERPLMEFAFDTDPKQSAQTRYKVLDMLARERIPMIAYHFPWPGIGHIAKVGDGFQFYPAAMVMQTLPG